MTATPRKLATMLSIGLLAVAAAACQTSASESPEESIDLESPAESMVVEESPSPTSTP